MRNCPVCLSKYCSPAEVLVAQGGYRVDCPACGKFALMEEAYDDFLDPQSAPGSTLTSVDRARLCHRIRSASRTVSNWPKIYSDFIERFIAERCPGPNPAQQATNLIRFVGREVERTGEPLEALPDDAYAIIGSPNPEFAGALAIQLKERGILTGIERAATMAHPSFLEASLTLAGWEQFEKFEHGSEVGKTGFIAMQFGDGTLDPLVQRHIKPSIKHSLNYDVVDMRDIAQAGVIDNIMREKIRDSAFVLVDLTHDNSGAYWEAGYAEGLGKPVIYLCEKNKFAEAKTHFDTNHCTTVIWDSSDETRFIAELIATIRRSLNLFES